MILEAMLLSIYGGWHLNGHVLRQYERSCLAKADIAMHGHTKPDRVACGALFLSIDALVSGYTQKSCLFRFLAIPSEQREENPKEQNKIYIAVQS